MIFRPDVKDMLAIVPADYMCVIVSDADFYVGVIQDFLGCRAVRLASALMTDPKEELFGERLNQFLVLVIVDVHVLQRVDDDYVGTALLLQDGNHFVIVFAIPELEMSVFLRMNTGVDDSTLVGLAHTFLQTIVGYAYAVEAHQILGQLESEARLALSAASVDDPAAEGLRVAQHVQPSAREAHRLRLVVDEVLDSECSSVCHDLFPLLFQVGMHLALNTSQVAFALIDDTVYLFRVIHTIGTAYLNNVPLTHSLQRNTLATYTTP